MIPRNFQHAVLLVLLGGVAAWRAGALPPPAALAEPVPGINSTAKGTASQGQMLTFCASDYSPVPIALCRNESNVTGHDVEVVRAAAADLGLTEGVDYRFKCMAFSDMMSDLQTPGSECSAGASGITITVERETAGIKFTYPYYKASLAVLAQSYKDTGNGFGFTRPFTWNLWMALLLTLILLPPLIFVIEFLSLRKRIHRDDVAPGVMESGWRGAITLMLFDHFAVTSLGARVAVLTFCFLALLITSTYTANLAAFVTVSTITSRITSVQDLRGKAVGTSPVYMDRLRSRYGIIATPFPFNNGSDYLQWRDMVASGQLAAMVRDEPALKWVAANAPGCAVTILSQTIEPFDYGIAFHVNASDALVEEWSLAILRLQEDGTLQRLKESWIANPQDETCQTTTQVSRDAMAVRFQDLYGLWIILGVGLALGALIMIAQRGLRRYSKHHSSKVGSGSREPMPEGRRPLHLLSAVRAYLPRSGRINSRRWRGSLSRASGSTAAKEAATPQGMTVAAAAATAASSAATAQAASDARSDSVHGCWDVERQSYNGTETVSMGAATPAQPPAGTVPQAAASGAALAAGQATQSSDAAAASSTVEAASPAAGAPIEERRASALQAAESVFAAYKWKSTLRTKAASP